MSRYGLIKELKNNIVVNKDEYLDRLNSIYIKNGISKSFIEQYKKGEGNELNGKFFSPISSSRLCFELFSWMADDDSIKDIEFEYYLPGLKSIHSHRVPQPNMDVYYEEVDINFIESKFTETSYNKIEGISKNYYDYYLDGNNNISKSVLDVCNIRFDGNLVFARYFIKLVNEILNYGENNNQLNKRDWFDLKQEITHVFGIGQYIYKYKPNKNINFYNLVYDFGYGISNLALEYKRLVNNMMTEYIHELGLNIRFTYDFMYMQDYVKNIDLNRKAFKSNKAIKEILMDFKLEG